MRNVIIGIVIGAVVGLVLGATVVAPRMVAVAPPPAEEENEPAADLTEPRPEQPEPEPAPTPSSVRWRILTEYSRSLPQVGDMISRLDAGLWRVSGGSLGIRFPEPGQPRPEGRLIDLVAAGAIDAAFSSPADWHESDPALHLFGSIPFGPDADEYLAWIYFGGGQEIYREILNKKGVHGLFCGLLAPGSSS